MSENDIKKFHEQLKEFKKLGYIKKSKNEPELDFSNLYKK